MTEVTKNTSESVRTSGAVEADSPYSDPAGRPRRGEGEAAPEAARAASSCCSTQEQATCCDPSEKAGCCGDAAASSSPSSCGCR